MLIGLTGKKNAGKDVVGAYLVEQYSFERRAFADPLKKSFAALFNIPIHKIEEWKNDPNMQIEIVEYQDINRASRNDPNFKFVEGMSFRQALQRYGTEAHRDIPELGNDIWVDATLPVGGFYVGRSIVVTDVRFQNEADRINMLGGYVVEVMRPSTDPTDNHPSELDNLNGIVYQLHNEGTILDLHQATSAMLTDLANLSGERI